MKFDELRRMVSVDMKIDGTELDIESLKTPQLHNKYLNLYHDERLILKQMRSRIKELVRDKWEFYSGKMSEEKLERLGWEPFQLKVLKQDIDRYIESDTQVAREYDRIAFQEEKVDFLQSTLKSITARQWDIKNAIEWRKFVNGI
jgi:hypothetical protein|tara:strand:+ start:398 stop:832 length:435 start_codon:yes stop_codon:yes gene_type:complete